MPASPRLLAISVAGLAALGATSLAPGQGAGSTPPGIPVVSASTPAFGIVYEYVETTKRNPKDVADVLSQKRRQYELQVKEGTTTRAEAGRILKGIETLPLREERRGTLTLVMSHGRIMASGQTRSGFKAWTRIEDGMAVSQPWSGGDAWTIENHAEPYSLASTLIPVMPFQLPAVRSFADIEMDGSVGRARMFAVSTTTDQYLGGTLRFERGRLAETAIRNIERTRFSEYTGGAVPLPKRIVFERDYDVDGVPQVVRTYVGRPIARPEIPTLKALAPPGGIVVLDRRTEPTRQFNYLPARGPLLDQAASGVTMPTFSRLPDASGNPIPFSTWLVGGSLVLLVGTAAARIVASRRAAPIRRS